MAVRFTPSDPVKETLPDRSDLAEVIDLRSRLLSQDKTGEKETSKQAKILQLKTAISKNYTPDSYSDADVSGLSHADSYRQELLRVAKQLLAKKQLSRAELTQKLTAAGFDAAAAAATVTELETRNYLSDADLAQRLSEKLRAQKGYSRSQIQQKLRARLLPASTITAVIEQLDQDEEQELLFKTATERAEKLKRLDYQTAERRLVSYLARRGWSGQQVFETARQALADAGITRSQIPARDGLKRYGQQKRNSGKTPEFR